MLPEIPLIHFSKQHFINRVGKATYCAKCDRNPFQSRFEAFACQAQKKSFSAKKVGACEVVARKVIGSVPETPTNFGLHRCAGEATSLHIGILILR